MFVAKITCSQPCQGLNVGIVRTTPDVGIWAQQRVTSLILGNVEWQLGCVASSRHHAPP